LVDVNLTPRWVEFFQERGVEAVHWSALGPLTAPDERLLETAAEGGYVLLTHDQDMGTLLALGKGRRPSVILLRTGDLRPQAVGPRLLAVLKSLEEDFRAGALWWWRTGGCGCGAYPWASPSASACTRP
jgi:predicted nuclease of predicted toxin-antitoxin system